MSAQPRSGDLNSVETAELDPVQDSEPDQEEQDDPDGGQAHKGSDLQTTVDTPV
jgi:hypothetical protein